MRHYNLTSEQREWIQEIQRNCTVKDPFYMSRIDCNPETGEVFDTRTSEYRMLGWLPQKAIPYRTQLTQQFKEKQRREAEARAKFERQELQRKPKFITVQGEAGLILLQALSREGKI